MRKFIAGIGGKHTESATKGGHTALSSAPPAFGWAIDPAKEYPYHTVAAANGRDRFSVLVDSSGASQTVSLMAMRD
ncbi:hypothetical protein [Kibdelosporangium phytohabitans]|uniref:hypothetical protein n=1 Tax=Kibdelosporangium phytohabitans TaxID=860235 RepID=UPI0012F8F503|nr:hypothetical protein [Kibdelosporangium phytohabitans]MBE1469119.1 hypothetical protein [Kibdelosporangium phytohabitans]